MYSYYGIWHPLVLLFVLFLRKAISNREKILQRIMIQIGIPNELTPLFRGPSESAYCNPELVLSTQ